MIQTYEIVFPDELVDTLKRQSIQWGTWTVEYEGASTERPQPHRWLGGINKINISSEECGIALTLPPERIKRIDFPSERFFFVVLDNNVEVQFRLDNPCITVME